MLALIRARQKEKLTLEDFSDEVGLLRFGCIDWITLRRLREVGI